MEDINREPEFYTVRLDGSIKTGFQFFVAFESINLGASGIDAWNRFFDFLWDRVTHSDIRVIVEVAEDFRLPAEEAAQFQWVMGHIDEDGHGRIVFTTIHN